MIEDPDFSAVRAGKFTDSPNRKDAPFMPEKIQLKGDCNCLAGGTVP
jgi:hypothetical protein